LETIRYKLKLNNKPTNDGKQAFDVVQCKDDEKPIECKLSSFGKIEVVDGHHYLGSVLGSVNTSDNISCNLNDKQIFSCHGNKWIINYENMTLQRNVGHDNKLVLG